MTEYIVLLPDNEESWAMADESRKQEVYAQHSAFARALAERGHKMTGGAELARATEGHVVRSTGSEVTITQGPYAESVEQLSGFYLVDTDNLDDLLQLCGMLAGESGLEVRPCVDQSGQLT